MLGQVARRVPADIPKTSAEAIRAACDTVMGTFGNIFHLAPVPHLMRSYTQELDVELRRTAENLSSVVHNIKKNGPETFAQLIDLVHTVADDRVESLTVVTAEQLRDVMFTLEEQRRNPPQRELTPAREMSNGLLRFITVAISLLTANRSLNVAK